MLRLTGSMQSQSERSAFTPGGDTAPSPKRSALLGALARAQGIIRQHTGALNRHAALEFTVRTVRPDGRLAHHHTTGGGQLNNHNAATRSGRRNRRAHRAQHSPLPRRTQPHPRTTPVSPHRGSYSLHLITGPPTLPTKLIDYPMKEATA
ncbi:type I-E CRISPR-associated protein Cas5/CasD [Streptomyces sp. NPDC014796]|uniref:type I-E CRISPR-associated protein Cas5/CasD n=1 Tax=Streptomyces sp. NPDC014796 TaxID=3364915 RepID=UPI0036FEF067